jgi:hypothetical protein
MSRLCRWLMTLVLVANGLVFISATALITVRQGDAAWLSQLHWGSFLTDLGGVLSLSPVPSGSLWIVWLVLTVLFTSLQALSGVPSESKASAAVRTDQVEARKSQIEASPQVQTHLQRLDRLLSQG